MIGAFQSVLACLAYPRWMSKDSPMHLTLKVAEKVQIRVVFAIGGRILAVVFRTSKDSISFGQSF